MRRNLILAFGAAAMLALAATDASANPSCASVDVLCVDTNDANAGSGNPLEPVTSQLPAQGILAIGFGSAQSPLDSWGFFDGDEGGPDPLDGYIGYSGADRSHVLLGLVGNAAGDFQRAGGNTSILALLPGAPMLPGAPALSGLPGVGVPALNGFPVGPSDTPVPLPDLSQLPAQVAELVGMFPSAPAPPDLGGAPIVLPASIDLIP